MGSEDDKLSERDAALQRYFDGEMPVEERAAFERSLTDEDQQRLAALAEVGAVLQSALEAEAADVDLWPALAAKLAAEPAPARGAGGKVVPLPTRRRLRATLWATVSGLAAAAGVALMLYMRTGPSSNNCDVETLETEGAVATVLQLGESTNNNAVTVIWTEED